VKLNLGCGSDLRPGWLNVDCRRLHPEGPEFLCCDLLALDGHVEDGSADRIVARDVLDGIPWREVDAVLAMLGKKLRPGGVLTMRVLDGEQGARAFAAGTLGHHEAQRLLYGDQGYPEDTRRSLWSAAEISRRLEMIGLKMERLEQRRMRLVARATR
jgi:predicted SAM-dependent methyltransferase